MNSKSTDDSGIIEVPVELSTSEEVEGSSLESRTERIRRLNRERQRRRRMKLKMSRHDEPTMASEACNVNVNLDNLQSLENANTGSDRTESTVKVELENTDSGLAGARTTRGRSSRRKRTYGEVVSGIEATNPVTSDSANNAITQQCHGGLATSSNVNELSEATDQLSVLVVASEIEVFGENPNVLNGAENVDAQTAMQSEDIGEVKRATRSRTVRREDDEPRMPRRKRSSTNSEEEITVRREKQRELKRKQKERMTPDQVEALRARYREWRRRRKEVMTPDQLEIIRRGNRERQRRRRERLGVRKRLGSGSSQGRGASEAVIQGLRSISQGRTASETSTSGESSKGSVSDLMSASGIVVDDKTAMAQGNVMGISPVSLPTMVTQLQNPSNQVATNVATVPTKYNQVPTSQQGISTIPVIGPQGAILPAMPAGTFFPMPGMQVTSLQGAIFPGMHVPVTGSQANVTNQNIATITTIPMTGVPGIQTAQGGFLSGIPVTSTTGNAQAIQQTFPNQSPLPREGQVLHNFQTLLPMTPVQASGQGMTFLTQLPFTTTGQLTVQAPLPDPKYTTANQTPTQIQGANSGNHVVQLSAPVEEPKPVDEPKPAAAPAKKAKSRGRKRNTSAAEMLASLSTYITPTSTPMSSMLSALASSARDRQSTDAQQADASSVDKNKTETVVLEASSSTIPVQGHIYAGTQQRGAEDQQYMVRTVVTTVPTNTTIDMNANNYALAAMNNGPSNIPHMNTFLTAMGGAATRAGVQYSTKETGQGIDVNRISVAVSTDNVAKATKSTSTGENVNPMSVGTMTDTLSRASVATNTEMAGKVTEEQDQEHT